MPYTLNVCYQMNPGDTHDMCDENHFHSLAVALRTAKVLVANNATTRYRIYFPGSAPRNVYSKLIRPLTEVKRYEIVI